MPSPSLSVAVAVTVTVAPAVNTAPAAGAVSDTVGGAFAQLRMALSTFSRPLVERIPVNPGSTSTELRMVVFNCAVVSAQLDSTSAAAPETCGVAIDVPLNDP